MQPAVSGGENLRLRSARNPVDSIRIHDSSSLVPGPGTVPGGGDLLHDQILIYYIVLTCQNQPKTHLGFSARPATRVASQVHHTASMHTAPQACCDAPMHRQMHRRRQGGKGGMQTSSAARAPPASPSNRSSRWTSQSAIMLTSWHRRDLPGGRSSTR